MEEYTRDFYSKTNMESSASIILPQVFEMYGTPKTMIDIGCATGAWLKAALDIIPDLYIEGVDFHENLDMLMISPDHYICYDLSQNKDHMEFFWFNLWANKGKFDMALCLETAEHLPEETADNLVCLLTQLSDMVIFSAATPGQPGINHINCKDIEYWKALFNNHNFKYEKEIRKKCQHNRIGKAYRDNICMFINRNR